ncbi:transcription antitermination factor NusB [Psychrobacter aestuarii]|uniref:16S rRNA (Cytosine(967)-C(5))-methyltransferase RsmB n=1 Tax=Psychrobacter aestuarii TaxID=556327 RepID=A0ABN0W411_9GAMM|nr:transcription antitermination factor NusB [Psychrobacter aestuarii]
MKSSSVSTPPALSVHDIQKGSVRARVLRTLLLIQSGHSLAGVLEPLLSRLPDVDRSFAHALLLTTLRHWHATARLVDSLSDKPIDEMPVRASIQLGITQLLYLEVADHAAINETVEAVKEIDYARASALTNAILRKVAKNPNKFRKKCNKNHSLPNWLAQQLKQDWLPEYDALTQALRQSAPIFLRVNTAVTDVEHYHAALTDAEIDSAPVTLRTATAATETALEVTALRLQQSVAIQALPDFETGAVSVQDAHAQLAAPILQRALATTPATKPVRLLDACAAPGGKLAHWANLLQSDVNEFHVKHDDAVIAADEIQLTAIDNEASRIGRIKDNLERLVYQNEDKRTPKIDIVCADATTWQAAKPNFDAILLDAPCTATGVIRRHPDIGLLRQESDVAQTVALQAKILDNLWSQLNAGGYLLYVTCSILKQENVEQMQHFISTHSDARAIDFNEDCNWGIEQTIGRQCLPLDNDGGDGFYYALLQKAEA